jgi:hypothetical protein
MYKNIALPAPKPSSWNIFSWITCGSSADVIPPSTAPTELEKIAIQINMTTFVRENYHAVLSEARCPCSGKAMPCPSAKAQFESALKTEPLNLEALEMGLFGLQSAIEKNITQIANKAMIQSFLETLNTNLKTQYLAAEIKDIQDIIRNSLQTLK